MREKMAALLYHRVYFYGTYQKNSTCGGNIPTVLIKDIYHQGNYMTDHVWLIAPRRMRQMHLKPGDIIQFSAVVKPYRRKNGTQDYTLEYPKHITRIYSVYQQKRKRTPKKRRIS